MPRKKRRPNMPNSDFVSWTESTAYAKLFPIIFENATQHSVIDRYVIQNIVFPDDT